MPTPTIPALRPPAPPDADADAHDVPLASSHESAAGRLVRATTRRAADRRGRASATRTPASAPRTPAPEPPPTEPRLLDGASLPDHVDRLYRAALALCGDPVDAEDLVQEVCLRALAKPRLIRGADDLPYLMQMLRNVFYNQCRSQTSRRTMPVEPESLTAVPAGRRHDPELGLLVREVQHAIAGLPPHYRDVVVAVDVLGLAYGDAAQALGIPVGTVMSRLHRARQSVARTVG